MVSSRSAALALSLEPLVAWKWLVVDLAEQTPPVGQSINQSSGGRREPVLFALVCVCACVSDPCDSWMVFAVQPDPSGLNKLDTLGRVVGAGVLAVTDCSRTDPIRCRNADADLQRHALAVTGPFVRACTCFTDSDLSCVKVPILSKFTWLTICNHNLE